MLYMLDTDISSYIIRGGHSILDRHLDITSPADRCISAMTRAELLFGLKGLPEAHYLQTMVRGYLKVTRLLPWGAEAADFHAEIRYQLRTAGTPIGEMDALIAAHALAVDAILVTNNTRHFQTIKLPLIKLPLKIENWMQ